MLRRLLRSILIGAATIFAAKRVDEHWSTPPNATVDVVHPVDLDGDGRPAG